MSVHPSLCHVCRPTFVLCYGAVPTTLHHYKICVGNRTIKSHGNRLNLRVYQVNGVWLVKWVKRFAEEVGEVVPVRGRMQKSIQKYYRHELYTLVAAHFTWDAIYDQMHNTLDYEKIVDCSLSYNQDPVPEQQCVTYNLFTTLACVVELQAKRRWIWGNTQNQLVK
ncbi:LOW QUALITY PROTEIN: hypothetical protein PHMEG_00019850 [Phytophthora megakarya]|uniref:Uncharacterized protein n=1 Tax=Phytophthora megakarya TaxID=4795 RepID=A0A225VQW2_9STRA|nr:LOW QUALITY PROTEIN: hypothetical protein PHMEG_00019850 [Phytophthora megakarya]